MANDQQQLALIEKPLHLSYLRDFRVEQCQLFLQHKCTQHRPFSCFYWHFQNQRRRRPFRRADGTFSYDPDFYCNDYDEQSGVCRNGDDCPLLHRNANDTEKRYHLRYYKTGLCTHESDAKGHCLKNGPHCSYAHGANDLRQPILDSREIKNTDLALERLARLCISLENERALNDDPKWSDSHYVLANYKTELCKRPPRLCRQGYACPQYHNPRDRRRNPSIVKYKSTPCPHVKQSDEWIDPTVCEAGDNCKYCHTRTEQQFHPEIYKSTKCNDVSVTIYCPRGPFCAFAHIEQELKSYRDFDLHYTSELPLSSFIPIPEDKEVGIIDTLLTTRNIPKKSSLFEVGSFPGAAMKTFDNRHSLLTNNSTSGTFSIQDMLSQKSSSQQRLYQYPSSPQTHQVPTPPPPPPSLASSSFLNEQFLLSAAALAASHSYPPPSSYLSSLAASNLLSSINEHFYSTTNYFDEKKDFHDQHLLPPDVKNLIESSLTAIGLDNVDENDFDKAAAAATKNERNNNTKNNLFVDDGTDNFERSTTPATSNTSPTHVLKPSTNQITRPVNIPNSFSNDYFSHSSSVKSPFDGPNQLFDGTLESPIDTPFPEPSTSSGTSSRPGERYKMAGFSQDLPTSSYQLNSTSPQTILQRLNTTSTNSPSSSSSEIDIMRNRVLQMQVLAMTEKESSEHWRREAEDNHRLAVQLEHEKNRAIQQRDDALHQIEHMRHLLVQNNARLLPSDHDLMKLPLDDVRLLQTQLQQELTKLALIEQAKSNNVQQTPPTDNSPGTPTSNSSPRQRQHKQNHGKHVLVSS
ncbi:unnamed protein product, partial [Adineta steineri]